MESNSKSQKGIKEKFRQGCVYIFKKWSAFRMALDFTPRVLTFYNEDKSVLEINEMLETLYGELYSTLSSGNFSGQFLIDELSDILYGFMNDYFSILLEDQSDGEIANLLIKLYNELSNGKDTLFKRLENYKSETKYTIDFPILGNQKVIFENNNDENEEEDEEEEEMDVEEEDPKEECHHHHENKDNKDNDKMEEEDDGFTVVKKGKGKGY
ncbi:MAG: pre-rRNA-processing TSR2 family protein [archaeon]|nr:pre-rRNA-processing TSR2 family protein [archaeon]